MEEPPQQPLSNEESLTIIRTMIARAKGNFKVHAFHFLLWGWIGFVGSIGHYFLLEFSSVQHPQLVWLIVIIGIGGSAFKGFKTGRNLKAKSYTGNIYGIIWIAFFINYLILLVFIARINFQITPLILVMAAASTFISGSLMRFRPLQLGALAIWVASVVAFTVSLPYQLLLTAGAILLGYLVPAYVLKNSKEGE